MEAGRARSEGVALASVGAERFSGRVAGARGPMAARHSRLRVPLLLVSVVVLRLPDRRDGQLCGGAAGGGGSAVSADRRASDGRRSQRFTGVRLGLSVWVSPGFAWQDHHAEDQPAFVDRLTSLCRL